MVCFSLPEQVEPLAILYKELRLGASLKHIAHISASTSETNRHVYRFTWGKQVLLWSARFLGWGCKIWLCKRYTPSYVEVSFKEMRSGFLALLVQRSFMQLCAR